MKDIPVYATDNGVASLVLKEVPYKQVAYITILDSNEPEKLLNECLEFCVAVGAEQVYATGHDYLDRYPQYANIVKMHCDINTISASDLAVFPVTDVTGERFRELYNDRMKDVPMASYMTKTDVKELLAKKTAYFVHKDGVLKGIGIIDGEFLDAIASVEPGAGESVLASLCDLACSDTLSLSVALENSRAVSLYRRCGFVIGEKLKTWYKVR